MAKAWGASPTDLIRKRTDEFGVTEPLVQQVGDDRIVVELAGVTDPARAKGIVQKAAFPGIPDYGRNAGAGTRALPALPGVLRVGHGEVAAHHLLRDSG